MRTVSQLLFALPLIAGLAGPAVAATFDFSFLASGVSVGQGSFSFPDADLSHMAVIQNDFGTDQFTSFNLSAGGYTFTLADFYTGEYIPSSDSFQFSVSSGSGFGYFINGPFDVYQNSGKPNFILSGDYYYACYSGGQCNPNAPPVFEGYELVTYNAAGTITDGVNFDTLLITPVTSVSEPGSASLLLTPLAGLVLLARSKGRRPKLAG